MPTTIDSLVVSLGLDTATFDAAQQQALDKLRRFEQDSRNVGRGIEAQAKSIEGMFSDFKRVALGMTAAFLGGMGVKEFTQHMITLEANTSRVARTMDVSAKELSLWQGVAERFGGTSEGMTNTLQNLSSELNKFQLTGQSGILQTLQHLHLGMYNANGTLKTSIQLFQDISEAINRMHMDPAQARAILTMLGYDQNAVNVALANQHELAAALDAVRKSGRTFSPEDERAAIDYQKALVGVEQSAQGLGKTLLTATAPAITKMFDAINAGIQSLRQGKDPETGQALGAGLTESLLKSAWNATMLSLVPLTGGGSMRFIARNGPHSIGTDVFGSETPAPPAAAAIATAKALSNVGGAPPSKSAMDVYAQAIANIESHGGDYSALGTTIKSGPHAGARAYGKYQVMDFNIPDWTKEVLGRAMTPEEFRADPRAQEAVFRAKFGQLVARYGPAGAAHRWIGLGKRDLGTGLSSDAYVDRFNRDVAANMPAPAASGGGRSGIAAMPPIGAGLMAGASNVTNRGGDTSTSTSTTTIENMHVNMPSTRDAGMLMQSVRDYINRGNVTSSYTVGGE